MSNLSTDHPDIDAYFRTGGFSVQRSDDNTFGRVPVDQTFEETINRDTQTPGGTKGFSLKAAALNRYYLTAEYRSSYLRSLKASLDMDQANSVHKDLQKTRTKRDEEDISSMMNILVDSWINPFSCEQGDLVCLSGGLAATNLIAKDLMEAKQLGEKAYKSFRVERLESDPPVKKIHDPLTRMNLKTFSSLNKKTKANCNTPKEVILKADRNLFAHMIIIAQSRKLDMKEVLKHPLGPIPWSLATSDGSLRKTCKVSLARELQKNVSPAESLPQKTACLIDGMALIQKINGDNKTFAEVAEHALSITLAESTNSSRVDVIFDVYREISIKNAERLRRGESESTLFKNISTGHTIKQWRKFLSNSRNKESLVAVIVQEWRHPRLYSRLSGKVLYVTCGESCYLVNHHGSETVHQLR